MAGWAGLPFGRGADGFRLLDDPARLELLGPEALRLEAVAAGFAAHRAPAADRPALHLDHARLLREHGARAGSPESLSRAARAAEAARDRDVRRPSPASARLEAAAAALAAAELTGDAALLDSAADHLLAIVDVGEGAPAARLAAARATVAARRALASGSPDEALEAGGLLDGATQALARLLRTAPRPRAPSRDASRTAALAVDLATARMERAALLVGFALRLRDAGPAERAAADMTDLLAALDGDRLPVLRARAARLCGEAQAAEGELLGCPRRLSAASRTLSAALDELPSGHAPVERARLARALGHAARALADAAEDAAAARTLDAAAVGAFSAAEAELGAAAAPTLHAELTFERALALAGASLRRPDAADARAAAEQALRAQLKGSAEGRTDPAAWAAVQLALGRLYAAEPGAPRRAEAVMACEAALEVFSEGGHRTLADTAVEALRALTRAG